MALCTKRKRKIELLSVVFRDVNIFYTVIFALVSLLSYLCSRIFTLSIFLNQYH